MVRQFGLAYLKSAVLYFAIVDTECLRCLLAFKEITLVAQVHQ